MVGTIFAADVAILSLALGGAVWSVAFPAKRIWPPPGRGSWQWLLTWACFYATFALGVGLIYLDWNSWVFQSPLRFIVGIPLVLLGGMLALRGLQTLGWRNTSGLKDGLEVLGPYRFTRNPQYVGDIVVLLGVGVIVNSAHLWIALSLSALCFAVAPLTEEPWLEEQYGDAYLEYRTRVPRFL